MQFELNKGGKVIYIANFLTEEFVKQLWNELKIQKIYNEPTKIKNKQSEKIEVEGTFGESKSGIKWIQYIADSYNKLISYPRLSTIMVSPYDKKKDYVNSDTTEMPEIDWTPCMKYLKEHIEKSFNEKISYALLHEYRDTSNYLGYHSDRELSPKDKIYSISLGIKRRFGFREKFNSDGSIKKSGPADFELFLESGSLIIFDFDVGCKNYKHSLFKGLKSEGHTCMDKNKDSICPSKLDWCGCTRINITFRTFY